MLKTIFAALAALLLAVAAHAAIDVNRASQAELEAVKGIGHSLSTRIVGERNKAEFKDWSDFVGRTKGDGAPLTGRREFDEPDFRAKTGGELVIPEDAHVRVVHPSNHGGARILRRGYNIADGTNDIGRMNAGLFFIGFVRDPRTQFVPIQMAMAKNDILMEYLRFTQSSVFAVPPGIGEGQSIGHALFRRGRRA